MADLAKLVVKLEAQTAKYQKELEQSNKKLKRFEKNTKKSISGIKTAFGLLGGVVAFKKIFDATAKQEQAFKQLEQGIKSTNKAVGFSARELANYASELQNATTFGDEDIINAQAQLVSFTKIAGYEFKRTTELALDLSTRFGTDLKSSSLQLGKALNDPVTNLSALSRAGIQFSDDQRKVIKSLVDSGNLVDAQQIILKELEVQFGGSARAARDTFGGALQALNNTMGDLLEGDGGLNEAKESIEALNQQLADPKTKKAAQELTGVLIKGFSGLVSVMAEVPDFAKFLGEEIAAAIHGPNDLLRINDSLAEKQKQLNALLKVHATEVNNGFSIYQSAFPGVQKLQELVTGYYLNDKDIQADRIAKLKEEINILNQKKELLGTESERPDLSGIKDNLTGGKDGEGDGGSSSTLTVAEEMSVLAEKIIGETAPKIIGVQERIKETAALFAQGLLTEEQATNAFDTYNEQLASITQADQVAHQDKLTRLQENFASEYEILLAQKEQRLELLNDEKTRRILSEQEIADLKLKINEDYNKAKEDLDKKSSQGLIGIAENAYSGILNIMNSSGKKGFESSKKAKKANALIATKDAAINAYNSLAGIPYIGPVLGAAAAVVATKYGMDQVKAIGSTQFGGGGSGGTSAPGKVSTSGTSNNFQTPGAANEVNNSFEQSQQIAQSRTVKLDLTVDDFTGEPMRKLVTAFNEETQDMGFEFAAQGA